MVTSSIQLFSFYLFYSLSAFVSSVQIKLKKQNKTKLNWLFREVLGLWSSFGCKDKMWGHGCSVHSPCSQCNWLLHAVPQHLIGCDKHDTDDESHSKGAYQAFPDTRLPILLLGMNWERWKKKRNEEIIIICPFIFLYILFFVILNSVATAFSLKTKK